MSAIDDVLAFWLGPPAADRAEFLKKLARWYQGGPALDAEIRGRFGALVEQALRGELDAWAETPRGRLALILLLDQFTRNAFRGTARMFAGDAKALSLALGARKEDYSFEERQFLLMPLQHAEDVAMQERCLAEMRAHVASAPEALRGLGGASIEQCEKYLDVIRRFGRFPHRNAWLGRESTPEEVEFLRTFQAAPSAMRGSAPPPEGAG